MFLYKLLNVNITTFHIFFYQQTAAFNSGQNKFEYLFTNKK